MTCRMVLRLAGDLLVGVHFRGRSHRVNDVHSGRVRSRAGARAVVAGLVVGCWYLWLRDQPGHRPPPTSPDKTS